MIAIHALLMIVYSVSEKKVAEKYELVMHGVAIMPLFIIAVIGSVKGLFYSDRGHCWIADRQDCRDACASGWNTFHDGAWAIIASLVWVVLIGLVIVSCMIKIYLTIYRRAASMRRYTFQATKGKQNRRATLMDNAASESAKQAMLYVAGLSLTYSVNGFSVMFPSHEVRSNKIVYLLGAVLLPLHGFWNFLAYVRPRFMSIRRNNEEISSLHIMKAIIFSRNLADMIVKKERRHQRMERRISFPVVSIEELADDKAVLSKEIYGENDNDLLCSCVLCAISKENKDVIDRAQVSGQIKDDAALHEYHADSNSTIQEEKHF